ncbi:hypothetical protein CMA01_23180 [Carnobacterium maltaromaticum]|uniref:ORF-3; unknown function n=1 Tax=Carnobacterium maltaromaticum TaxID=2751 RepID=Q46311_CARML|nr:ORF-3; unknown function [Carnobacterium maltaromaticum]GED49908.1 hypothetical protein CMA01_23180 [Carnobacterium maltaromaticum]
MKNFFKKNNMLYRFFAVIGLIFGGWALFNIAMFIGRSIGSLF